MPESKPIESLFEMLWRSSIDGGHLHLRANNIELVGIEHGTITAVASRPVDDVDFLLVREGGRRYWAGRGVSGYSPAEIVTLAVERVGSPRRYVRLASSPVQLGSQDRRIAHDRVVCRTGTF